MMAYKPVHGGFIRACVEYVDPAFGFAVGMSFWFAVSKPSTTIYRKKPVANLNIYLSG